jgi:hypothetical protein
MHTTIADILAALPPGSTLDIATALPPVVSAANASASGVDVSVGGIGVTLTVPGFFDQPVSFEVGATGTVALGLAGQLQGTGLTPGSLHVSQPDAVLDGVALGNIYLIGAAVAQDLLSGSVSAAATAISTGGSPGLVGLPVFPFSSSFATFGLPGAGAFGVVGPTLVVSDPTLVLRGGLGVR